MSTSGTDRAPQATAHRGVFCCLELVEIEAESGFFCDRRVVSSKDFSAGV